MVISLAPKERHEWIYLEVRALPGALAWGWGARVVTVREKAKRKPQKVPPHPITSLGEWQTRSALNIVKDARTAVPYKSRINPGR